MNYYTRDLRLNMLFTSPCLFDRDLVYMIFDYYVITTINCVVVIAINLIKL